MAIHDCKPQHHRTVRVCTLELPVHSGYPPGEVQGGVRVGGRGAFEQNASYVESTAAADSGLRGPPAASARPSDVGQHAAVVISRSNRVRFDGELA